MNKINDIHEFKLPLEYCSKKNTINETICQDIELTNIKDDKEQIDRISLYNKVFSPNTEIGVELLNAWSKHISYDKKFIKCSQKLYKNVEVEPCKDVDDIYKLWLSVKNETGFLSKYHYVEWEYFEYLNKNDSFLQVMSVYSLSSPVFSLMMPIFLLIVPFFLLKIQRIDIGVTKYFEILKTLFTKLPIGKLFMMKNMSWDNRVYTVVSVLFYFFQIYQNILSCYRFYKNQYYIENTLYKFKTLADHSIKQIDKYLVVSDKLGNSGYMLFNNDLKINRERLVKLSNYIDKIKPFKLRFNELSSIGYKMKHFYEFYKNNEVNKTMNYIFGLNAYFDHIIGIKKLIKSGAINKCKISKKHTSFKQAHFASIEGDTVIKNTYDLKNNTLITGPNAAGKTTILKATLFNVILSQQIGYGFYKSAKITPYKYLHSYLNIPDTSGRDSLFQAEARRCKEIMEKISETKTTERHFCIFDEIYSGTNPYEATASAYSYLQYLSKYTNVSYMITTHYTELCKKIDKSDMEIKNHHMEILEDKQSGSFIYSYLLKQGISEVKGGIKVLRDLGYPIDMINNTREYLDKN